MSSCIYFIFILQLYTRCCTYSGVLSHFHWAASNMAIFHLPFLWFSSLTQLFLGTGVQSISSMPSPSPTNQPHYTFDELYNLQVKFFDNFIYPADHSSQVYQLNAASRGCTGAYWCHRDIWRPGAQHRVSLWAFCEPRSGSQLHHLVRSSNFIWNLAFCC